MLQEISVSVTWLGRGHLLQVWSTLSILALSCNTIKDGSLHFQVNFCIFCFIFWSVLLLVENGKCDTWWFVLSHICEKTINKMIVYLFLFLILLFVKKYFWEKFVQLSCEIKLAVVIICECSELSAVIGLLNSELVCFVDVGSLVLLES